MWCLTFMAWYTSIKSLDPTKTLAKGKQDQQFLPLVRHPPCYSYNQYVLGTTKLVVWTQTYPLSKFMKRVKLFVLYCNICIYRRYYQRKQLELRGIDDDLLVNNRVSSSRSWILYDSIDYIEDLYFILKKTLSAS